MSRNEKRKNIEMQSFFFFSNLKLLFFSKRIHKLHFVTSKRYPTKGFAA